MSLHNKPLTELEKQGLLANGLSTNKASQLSDAFRLGVAWAVSNTQTTQTEQPTNTTLVIPTWEMRQAGNAIVEALQVHKFNLRLYGLGEAKTIEEWIPTHLQNQDLIVSYLQGKMDIPTAMYLAMRRAKVALK